MSKTICPKCGCKDLDIIETLDAICEHRVKNGVWIHAYDNNEYGNVTRIECVCRECGHIWTGRKGQNFENYIEDEE